MFYGRPRSRVREEGTGAIAPIDPSSFADTVAAGFHAAQRAYNLNAAFEVKEEAFDAASDGVFDLTGVRLPNPARDVWARVSGRDPVLEFEKQVLDLAENNPDKARDIRRFANPLQQAYAMRREAVEREADVTARSLRAVNLPWLGPVDPGVLIGNLAGSMTDPATLLVNSLGAAGKGGSLLYHFARSAIINAGAEVAQQPFIKAWANEAGDPYGWDDAARSVAAAALLGGALDLGIRGGYRGVQRARGLEPVRGETGQERGLITGWRSPEDKAAALDAAAARLPADNPVRQALDGDVAAVRQVAEATGAIEDPVLRGAIMAREMSDDLDGPPPMAVDGGEGYMSLAQALRHATDPDEPPPAVLASLMSRNLDMSPDARLTRARDMGFDTERVLFNGSASRPVAFDLEFSNKFHPNGAGVKAIWFTPSERRAGWYATQQAGKLTERVREANASKWFWQRTPVKSTDEPQAHVGAYYIRPGRQATFDRSNPTNSEAFSAQLRRAYEEGYDSVVMKGHMDEPENGVFLDEIIVFDPKNIRSVNAAFDPDEAASPRLLASFPAEARRNAGDAARVATDPRPAHATLLGASDAHSASALARIDDVAGAEAKAQLDRLERDLTDAVERATKPDILAKKAEVLADIQRKRTDVSLSDFTSYFTETGLDKMAARLRATSIRKLRPWSKHPGKVLALHGSRNIFSKFDLAKQRDFGVHFGTAEQAANFTKNDIGIPEGHVYPVVIDVRNPVDLPDLGIWAPGDMLSALREAGVKVSREVSAKIREADNRAALLRQELLEPFGGDPNKMNEAQLASVNSKYAQRIDADRRAGHQALRDELGRLGYDGIRYRNSVEGKGWSYIVWDQGRVTSATAGDVMYDVALEDGRYVHAHAATERMEEIRSEIDRTVKMLPRDVKLRVQDELIDFGYGRQAQGAWDGYDRIVYVSLAAGDPVRTARHETVHALRQSGLMSDAEFDTLYQFAESVGLRKAYKIDENYGDVYAKAFADRGSAGVEALLREETIADMFADYSLNGRRFADEFGRQGRVVDKILDAIVKFLKQVRDALHIRGFQDVRDIFEAIESGAMAARAERVALPGGAEIEGFHLFALKAFHGTPHTFAPEEGAPAGRFRASQIGTGEGAQVYGHGLYFAESEGVAKWYRDELTSLQNRKPAAITTGTGNPFDGVEMLVPDEARPGRLYEVRIDAEPEMFLDWDKPLGQQSDAVQKAVLPLAREEAERELRRRSRTHAMNDAHFRRTFEKDPPPRPEPPSVDELALRLWGNEFARGNEAALREAGVVGIRYLDGSSRGAGVGTSNFVIFPGNEHLVEIVAVDGQPVVNLAQDLADAKRDGGLGKLVEACRL